MDRNVIAAALAPALLLYACERAVMPEDGNAPSPSLETVETKGTPGVDPVPLPPPPPDGSRDAANDGFPDLTPAALTPEAERGETGARNVLLSFARALELQEFDQAWTLLSQADRQKWSKAAFARNFAGLDNIAVAIPDGTTDSAAGSIYYLAPMIITAADRDGRPIRYEGEAVLKRVNGADGATEAQLRWQFDRLTLDWTH